MNRILEYQQKHLKGYGIGLALLIAINIFGAYIPQLIKSSVDLLQLFANLNNTSTVEKKIVFNVVLIITMAAAMAVMRTASRWIVFGIGRQVEFDLKKDIFDHLVSLQPGFFAKAKAGDLISIITNDVQSLRAISGFAVLNILNTLIAFSIIIPLMFKLNVKLTAYFLVLVPVILLLVTFVSKKIKSYQELVQEKLGDISHFIEQNLSGIHIIKAYAQEDAEVQRFAKYNNSLLHNYLKLVKMRSLIGPLMKAIASLGFILLLYIGGKAVINEHFSLGDFAAYSLYIERLIWPIGTLGWLVTIFYRAKVSMVRIENILDIKPSIADHSGSIEKKTFDSEINLKALGTVIKKSSAVGIVGTIGSGKSTLAAKLMRLVELANGEILVDGIDINNIRLKSLRSLINLVPQNNFLFSTTVKENIAYAKDLSDEKIIELAKLVRIHDEIMNFPEQYDTLIGERGITLSGGQRQRIAIARALAIDPEVLILDDALSSVDNDTAAVILNNIHKLRQDRTTIFITHKISIVKELDQIIVMDKLKIVEQGTHDELIRQSNSIYKSLWDLYMKSGLFAKDSFDKNAV